MSKTATAAVLTDYRAFDIQEFPIPEITAGEGVLRVEAAGLCGTDFEQYAGHMGGTPWSNFPLIPGHEIVGRIDRVGKDAARKWGVREGDRVVVEASLPCGTCFQCAIGAPMQCIDRMSYGMSQPVTRAPSLWGGYATHMYLHSRTTLHKAPDGMSAGLLSLTNPLSNAVHWMSQRPGTKAGDSVVIQGPGQRGLAAVMVARDIGASQIIITGTSADRERLAMARTLGADEAIVVDDDDPVEKVLALTDGKGADVVLDVSAGSTTPVAMAIDMVRAGGTIVLAGIKGNNPIPPLDNDKIVLKQISLLGAFSSGTEATRIGIDLLVRYKHLLEPLCTHSFPLIEAEKAVRILGREISDGREPIHIHIDAA